MSSNLTTSALLPSGLQLTSHNSLLPQYTGSKFLAIQQNYKIYEKSLQPQIVCYSSVTREVGGVKNTKLGKQELQVLIKRQSWRQQGGMQRNLVPDTIPQKITCSSFLIECPILKNNYVLFNFLNTYKYFLHFSVEHSPNAPTLY